MLGDFAPPPTTNLNQIFFYKAKNRRWDEETYKSHDLHRPDVIISTRSMRKTLNDVLAASIGQSGILDHLDISYG
jgi:hypothetical protein